MFFINKDFESKAEHKTLSDILFEDSVKVSYGILSLKEFYKMVKHIGNNTKIFIPKVQRGLVWNNDAKNTFIENCVVGKEGGVKEPMPNIFLFFDTATHTLQLFDGLQRTSAVLDHFKNYNEISDVHNIMVPIALFKGNRVEAEELFRNINEKGIKLNDFERLASLGGAFEVNLENKSQEFKTKFNNFVEVNIKQYKDRGLYPTTKEKSTIYEILTYAIFQFSNHDSAKRLFPNANNLIIQEWGYQVAYSTTTSKKTKAYSRKNMTESMLLDFAKYIEYDFESKVFNENKLENYILNMKNALDEAEKGIRDIYQRNIISSNDTNLSSDALKSQALIGALIIKNFLQKDSMSINFTKKWFLLQLISNRASSNTNTIVDELLIYDRQEEDLDTKIKHVILQNLEDNPLAKNHKSWLWTLFYIQMNYLSEINLASQLEIDHIIPKKILKKYGLSNYQNHLCNLMLIDKEINRDKSSQMLWEFFEHSNEQIQAKIKQAIIYGVAEQKVIDQNYNKLHNRNQQLGREFITDSLNLEIINAQFQSFISERKGQLKSFLTK